MASFSRFNCGKSTASISLTRSTHQQPIISPKSPLGMGAEGRTFVVRVASIFDLTIHPESADIRRIVRVMVGRYCYNVGQLLFAEEGIFPVDRLLE